MLLSHFEPPTKHQERWKEELNTEIVNWDLKYEIPFYCTKTPINLLFFNTKYCIEFCVLILSCLNVDQKRPKYVIFVMKQKKQFCTYSGNVILSKVYGWK
jgi:hypothetical protein